MAWHQKKHPGFWRRSAILWKILGSVLLIAAGLGFFYSLSLLGPRASDRTAARYILTEDIARLLDQSIEHEKQYRDAIQVRAPSAEDMERLAKAIELQQQYLREVGGYDRQGADRLQELQTLQQDQLALGLIEESRELEVRSARALGESKIEEGVTLLSEAFELQKKVNELYPLSQHSNLRRYTELERRLHELKARPLMDRSLKAEQEAQHAIEGERWVEAQGLLREAIATQRQLNREYANLRYANIPRVEQLENRLASLESTDLHQEIEAMIVKATALEEEGAWLEAASMFQEAVRAQQELNERYARSRFASSQRLEQLEHRQRVAVSRELAEEILAETERINAALRQRQPWQVVEHLEDLYHKAERFHDNFPRSPQITAALVAQLQYLTSMRNELSSLQEEVYAQLFPVPGMAHVHMSKTEVPQALYEKIMGANPSRVRGAHLPVVSLNWQEAQDFCQRIDWILARPVRLPELAEFQAAVGDLRLIDIDAMSWHAGNSDSGQIQVVGTSAANANGFYDLLGNVSEWLAVAPSSSGLGAADAQIVGGNVQTQSEQLLELEPETTPRRERNRMVGFRYVVEVSDD